MAWLGMIPPHYDDDNFYMDLQEAWVLKTFLDAG